MNSCLLIYNKADIDKNKWFIEELISSFRHFGIALTLIDEALLRDSDIDKNDFAIYRGRNSNISKKIESKDKLVINNSYTNKLANDKFLFYEFLLKEGYPCMETFSSIEDFSFSPFIAKPKDGHSGNGVFLFDEKNEFLLNVKEEKRPNYIFQKPSSTLGKDLRIYVLNKKIYGAVLRESNGSDFRSNYSLGGNVSYFDPPEMVKSIALSIAKKLDSFFVGIDFIINENKFVVNEMEDPVGSRMLYKVSNKNVTKDLASEIVSSFKLN